MKRFILALIPLVLSCGQSETVVNENVEPYTGDMTKIYVMETCPDCTYVEEQIKGKPGYEIIDIGSHVRKLKEFLAIRDTSHAFDEARAKGQAGIPCFVLEDGTVTLRPEDLGLQSRPEEGASCSIDGTGC